jgi:hypothetical protein
MRLRNFVNLCVVVGVALFILIPESQTVALFVWEGYIFGPPDEYTEADGTVVLTQYALNVSPLAYLPYICLAVGLVALVLYLVRRRAAR